MDYLLSHVCQTGFHSIWTGIKFMMNQHIPQDCIGTECGLYSCPIRSLYCHHNIPICRGQSKILSGTPKKIPPHKPLTFCPLLSSSDKLQFTIIRDSRVSKGQREVQQPPVMSGKEKRLLEGRGLGGSEHSPLFNPNTRHPSFNGISKVYTPAVLLLL